MCFSYNSFKYPFQFPFLTSVLCSVQSVPGPWCCVWVVILWGQSSLGRLDGSSMGHTFCFPSPQPFPCSLAWTSQAADLHSQPHPWLQADGGRTVTAFLQKQVQRDFPSTREKLSFFQTLLLWESMLKAVKSVKQYHRLPFNRRALPSSFTLLLLLQSLEHLKLPLYVVQQDRKVVSHIVMDWITALTFSFSNRHHVYQDTV